MDDQMILELKAKGKSLRAMAATLNLSHEAVRKRLKAINDKAQISTNLEDRKEIASTIEKEKVSTGPKARQSRASGQVKHTVNRVSTSKAPSHNPAGSVNPLETLAEHPTEGRKGVSQEVCLEFDDLFGAIKGFLESKGIEVYRMQNGGYQVKGKKEIVRFYISHRNG